MRSSSVHRTRGSVAVGLQAANSPPLGGDGPAAPAVPAASALPLSLRDYRMGRELGRGGFGVVFEALHGRTGEAVAIKRLSLAAVTSEDLPSVLQEIELLKRLKHPNIVRYIDTGRTREYLYIVLELVENGSLSAAIKRFGTFSEQLAALYVSQVLRGLAYLHEQGVIHRDIKAANILTTKEGIVKLTDFGVAMSEREADDSAVGSPFWMCPEIIEMAGTTPACDIWSLGATVIELLTGKPPYFDLPAMSALFHIVQDESVPIPEGISPALRDFLSRCFHKSPPLRATAMGLLSHPWITTNLVLAASSSAPTEGSEEVVVADEDESGSLSAAMPTIAPSWTSGVSRDARVSSKGHGRHRMSVLPQTASVKVALAQQQGGNAAARSNANVHSTIFEDTDWDATTDATVTTTMRFFKDDHGALLAKRAAEMHSPTSAGTATPKAAKATFASGSSSSVASGSGSSLLQLVDDDSEELGWGLAKKPSAPPAATAAKPRVTAAAAPPLAPLAALKSRHAAVASTIPTGWMDESEETEDWSFAPGGKNKKPQPSPLAAGAGASASGGVTKTASGRGLTAMGATATASRSGGKGGVDDDGVEEELSFAAHLSAGDLKERLAARTQGVSGVSEASTSAAGLDAHGASGGKGGGGESQASVGDDFSMFDSSDFKADEKAEATRSRQREVMASADALATAAMGGEKEEVERHVRKLVALFTATPTLRHHLVRNHGVLPLLEALHVKRNQPAIVLSLLHFINALVEGDASLQESLSMVGVLPAVLQFSAPAYPTPLRNLVSKYVTRLVGTSPTSRQIFTACGGIHVAVGLLLPTARPSLRGRSGSVGGDDLTTALGVLKRLDIGVPGQVNTPNGGPILPLHSPSDLSPTEETHSVEDALVSAEFSVILGGLTAMNAVFELQRDAQEQAMAMSANEFRRLFVKAGVLGPASAALRSTFMYICAQVSSEVSSRAMEPKGSSSSSTSTATLPLTGFCHWHDASVGAAGGGGSVIASSSPSSLTQPMLSPFQSYFTMFGGPDSGLTLLPGQGLAPAVASGVAVASAPSSTKHESGSALSRVRDGAHAKPAALDASMTMKHKAPSGEGDDDEDDDEWNSGFITNLKISNTTSPRSPRSSGQAGGGAFGSKGSEGQLVGKPGLTGNGSGSSNATGSSLSSYHYGTGGSTGSFPAPAPMSTRRSRSAAALGPLPHMSLSSPITIPPLPKRLHLAMDCLARLADVFALFAQGDAPIKVSLATPTVATALLRILRPAPYALLHHPLYAPVVLRALKAIKLISMDPQVVEVLDACGAVSALVPFLVRESGIGVDASGGGAPGAVSALHSKDVQNYVLHSLFNMCRVSRVRQTQAATCGIIPSLNKVVLSTSPLKTLALPILCDLAHAGSKARNLLFENDAAPVYIHLLSLEYWHIHALNSLADWVNSDATRLQPYLTSSTAIAALTSVLQRSTAYLDAVLGGLGQIVERCPAVARALSRSDDLMKEVCERLLVPRLQPFTIKSLLGILRVLLECSEDSRALVARWNLVSVITSVATEARAQGRVIMVPITDSLLKLCGAA